MKTKNVREVALETLLQIENNQAYSNLLLNQTVKKGQILDKDIPLLTELVYGTVQRRDSLDYFLEPFIKKAKKMEGWVRMLLRLSVYQMVFLDKVPDRAILHEAVNIAKKRGHQGIAGFVNGVLRTIQREGIPDFSNVKNEQERLAKETSTPLWLIKRWVEQYGYEETAKMCQINLEPPHVSVRVNVLKATVEEAMEELKKEGIALARGDLSSDSIKILKGNVFHTTAFKAGMVTIQDESSMLVARALAPKENTTVLDCCAAPGGKTTHLAEQMNNKGTVIALDLHPHKVKLIDEAAERLELSVIKSQALDARKAGTVFAAEQFDAILVDAPCSGFGVIRRKPDLKWTKKEEDVEAISAIQRSILKSVAPLLKKGGRLVYSTCTIDRCENEEVVEEFLLENQEFQRDPTLGMRLPKKLEETIQEGMVTILPHHYGTDGFFVASLIKT